MPPDSFPLVLDRERRIAYTQRARYRMGALDRPFELGDLARPRKSYAALVGWLWACLVPADAADFATPEDLAAHVPATPEGIAPLFEALLAALRADEKKTPVMTTGPLPGSNSA